MKIVNLTPHDIHLHLPGGVRTIARSGKVARVTETRKVSGEFYGIPIVDVEHGAIEGLPPRERDVVLIVSSLVAQAARSRDDLVVPGEPVRDESGRVVGAKDLARYR